MEPNLPEQEGYEYGYAYVWTATDTYADSSKCEPVLSVEALNINATIMKEEDDEDKEIQLSLNTKELIDARSMTLSVLLC